MWHACKIPPPPSLFPKENSRRGRLRFIQGQLRSVHKQDSNQYVRRKSSKSEILANIFADMGGENLAKFFADFRPSISRKSGCKKFHEKSSTNFAGRETKFFNRETLGAWPKKSVFTMRFPIQSLRWPLHSVNSTFHSACLANLP